MRVSFIYPSSNNRTAGVVVLYRFANGLARRGVHVNFIHGPRTPHRVDRLSDIPFDFASEIEHHWIETLEDSAIPAADLVMHSELAPRCGHPFAIIQGANMFSEEWERAAFQIRGPKFCVASWLLRVGRGYGVPAEQLIHMPVGVDRGLFQPPGPLTDRPIDLVVLHHPHAEKGWDVAADVLDQLTQRRPATKVTVFGSPTAPLLPEGIEYRQMLSHQTLVDDVYGQAKVFLQTSWHEGFGYTPVEAMSCGAALVSTDCGGSEDYAVDGTTALVAPPGDVSGLCDRVTRLLDDPTLRTRIAEAGMDWTARFDWDACAERLHLALENYLADPAALQAESAALDGPNPALPPRRWATA